MPPDGMRGMFQGSGLCRRGIVLGIRTGVDVFARKVAGGKVFILRVFRRLVFRRLGISRHGNEIIRGLLHNVSDIRVVRFNGVYDIFVGFRRG